TKSANLGSTQSHARLHIFILVVVSLVVHLYVSICLRVFSQLRAFMLRSLFIIISFLLARLHKRHPFCPHISGLPPLARSLILTLAAKYSQGCTLLRVPRRPPSLSRVVVCEFLCSGISRVV